MDFLKAREIIREPDPNELIDSAAAGLLMAMDCAKKTAAAGNTGCFHYLDQVGMLKLLGLVSDEDFDVMAAEIHETFQQGIKTIFWKEKK